MPVGSWQDFNDNLFIKRPRILQKIVKWILDQDPRKRVLCLIAPPGSGKSWLLGMLKKEFEKDPNPYFNEPLLIFYLDAPSLIDRNIFDRERVIKIPEALKWIQDCYEKARLFCTHIPPFDPSLAYPQSLATLIDALCNNCVLPQGFLVLVDGYDEMPERHREVLSDRLLSQFIRRTCVRMIITQRDQTGLSHFLLKAHQMPLPLVGQDKPIDAFDQFERVRKFCYGDKWSPVSRADFNDWRIEKSRIRHYHWDNPYANRYFYEVALENLEDGLQPLQYLELRDCIKSLVEHPHPEVNIPSHYPQLSDDHLDLLSKMAFMLPEEFTNDLMEEKLEISVFDNDLVKEFMTEYGILVSVEGTIRYKLIGFIRDLLLDMEDIHNEGTSHE